MSAFTLIHFTQGVVFKAIMSIEVTGKDEISPWLLKLIFPHILPYITHIFNSIITISNYPIN